ILISYGTGAIMAVPGHDERDWEFAKEFGLPIIQVVSKDGKAGDLKEAFTEEGIAVNSGQFSGMKTAEFKEAIISWLSEQNFGERAVNYKLRDWIFSRQRYWGEPIPLVHCEKCGIVPVPESKLPLKLPEVESYKPTGTGESPLAAIEDWVNTECPSCGGPGKRETNTMPQWAGSCWYYLRYLDPHNKKEFAAKDKIDYWMPVDLYVGGAEHAVLHLLYSRFWHKVLFDLGFVANDEPFQRLVNQGMILGEGGVKMSKSLGNVINPDDIVRDFGADSMRMYEMFMGPLETSKPWSTSGLAGIHRFLDRVWRTSERELSDREPTKNELKILHKTIKKVSQDTGNLEFNTAIAQMMIFINEVFKIDDLPRAIWEPFVQLLAPYAPHLGEELWEKLGNKASISNAEWPQWQEELTKDEELTVVVQVNGKVRAKLQVERDLPKDELERLAFANERIAEWTEGKTVRKVITVPNKLVNIVVS
ncbi:MAG: leucine--tRNA ligase, partial [Spirochaetia bacterium]